LRLCWCVESSWKCALERYQIWRCNSCNACVLTLCGADVSFFFQNPKLLNRFIVVTFADLKNHKFFYWCGFPVFKSLKFTHDPSTIVSLKNAYSANQVSFFAVKNCSMLISYFASSSFHRFTRIWMPGEMIKRTMSMVFSA
jgi:hypothetical protein